MLALNQWSYENQAVPFLLQDFYAQPGVLAHKQTIAVEITGHSFDSPEFYPGTQKIANVIAVVWAIMKRYSIPAKDIMGHFELQLSKPDPGKKFLALVKYLIGIKALIDEDEEMKALVFDPFDGDVNPHNPVRPYFNFIRDYLLLTTSPQQVYQWDAWSKFLFTFDALFKNPSEQFLADEFCHPLVEPTWQPGYRFLAPGGHEGVDIYPKTRNNHHQNQEQPVHLIANGECVHIGEYRGFHKGQLAIFKHRQKDGSEILSCYAHLVINRKIKVGVNYSRGWVIGKIHTPPGPPHGYLHLSIAYGPSWEIFLKDSPNIPLNAGPVWIRLYFIDPLEFLVEAGALPYDPFLHTRFKPT
jgi:hypothetical protein